MRHEAVFEDQLAGTAGANAELVLLLADREARCAAFDEKRGDAAIAGVGLAIGEDDEEVGFVAVGNPELAPGDAIAVIHLGGASLQRKRIAAGPGLG